MEVGTLRTSPICRMVREGLRIMPVLFAIHADVCCCVQFGPDNRSLVMRILNAPMGGPDNDVACCSCGIGLLVRLAVGIALRLVVGGVGMAVVVEGYVAMVLSWVPGSILIALPPTNANLPCRPTESVSVQCRPADEQESSSVSDA